MTKQECERWQYSSACDPNEDGRVAFGACEMLQRAMALLEAAGDPPPWTDFERYRRYALMLQTQRDALLREWEGK